MSASDLDLQDEQKSFDGKFVLPTNKSIGAEKIAPDAIDEPCVYFCGNSLGAMPKRAAELVKEELDIWGSRAVEGHFSHPKQREWKDIATLAATELAPLIGASEDEIACMASLTSNLHLMMNTFYQPTPTRFKILCEYKAFPSDQYAFNSQASLHGFDPKDTVLEVQPRPGEYTIRTEDILDIIKKEGQSIAIVLFSGVQYYTGQYFQMEAITKFAQEQGCVCGWDLAHAIGNVPLSLHDWGVDFAVWCSYKYLNSGPGTLGGLFLHQKWDKLTPKFAGWWGHDPDTRFDMPPTFSPAPGAKRFAQSNPSVLATTCLLGSLEVFKEAGGIQKLRGKSIRLTSYLEKLFRSSKFFVEAPSLEQQQTKPCFTIITPSNPEERGAQLSVLFAPSGVMQKIDNGLKLRGIIGDERRPDVIRLTPIPLYNTFQDCQKAAIALDESFEELV
ncbi:hypothetical protein Clacol_006300 [Clathrus columnatus]|uniref:Kynureninase n=1 Tax=Clathrus columnatus TaxID=1419009 RepID=A0AAV5ABR0_9AGAM|nr:hypothetical protein Clacol_006300 [Clathrus columnatus]